MAGCWLHGHASLRSRSSEDCREMQPGSQTKRVMLLLVWCGLRAVLCRARGAGSQDGGEMGEVAPTIRRGLRVWSLESGVEPGIWSLVWCSTLARLGWRCGGIWTVDATTGDQPTQSPWGRHVPAVPPTHRPPCQPQKHQSCQPCNSCHGLRNMADVCRSRRWPGSTWLDLAPIAMHLFVSACLVRPSRACQFFFFVFHYCYYYHDWILFPLDGVLPRNKSLAAVAPAPRTFCQHKMAGATLVWCVASWWASAAPGRLPGKTSSSQLST